MTKLSLILVGFLTISSVFAANQVNYRYERDLVEMYDHPENFAGYEKEAMFETVDQWIRINLRDHIAGRVVLSNDDLNYILRIGAMACDIINYREDGILI